MLGKIIETKLITAGFDQRIVTSLSEKEVFEYITVLTEFGQLEAEQADKVVKSARSKR